MDRRELGPYKFPDFTITEEVTIKMPIAESLVESSLLDELRARMQSKMMQAIDQEIIDLIQNIPRRQAWRTCL